MNILNKIRKNLLREAKQSPSLLFELSKLEEYIAETYYSRVIIELLQNSDDANSTKFLVQMFNGYLICANNGNNFTESDFESICGNAKSTKKRGESIGYRGIGFKSVIDISNVIHLFSGEIEVTFSKKLTKDELNSSYDVPLIRIPHKFKSENELEIRECCHKLKESGFNTVFIFEDVNQEKVINEINNFNEECILFVRNVNDVQIIKSDNLIKRYVTSRYLYQNYVKNIIQIHYRENIYNESWRIYSHDLVSVAINEVDDKVMPLKYENGFVHAFLPSNDLSGIACRLNGDFTTDPSRTRLVIEEKTKHLISMISEYLKNICLEELHSDELFNFLEVFAPQESISLISLRKSNFSTLLVSEIIEKFKVIGKNIIVYPDYLSDLDAKILYPDSRNVCISEISNIKIFLKAIKVNFINYNDVMNHKNIVSVNENSKEKLVQYYCANENTLRLQGINSPKTLKIFNRNGKLCSAEEINITRSVEQTNTLTSDCDMLNVLQSYKQRTKPLVNLSTIDFDWRNAENFAHEFFTHEGFSVEDRSKSNLGYDLYIKKDHIEYMIEIKFVDYIGASFMLTTNEEAVARLNPNKYIIFLLQKSGSEIKYAFIKDLANNITMNRQCRQWVWDCSSYNYLNNY